MHCGIDSPSCHAKGCASWKGFCSSTRNNQNKLYNAINQNVQHVANINVCMVKKKQVNFDKVHKYTLQSLHISVDFDQFLMKCSKIKMRYDKMQGKNTKKL